MIYRRLGMLVAVATLLVGAAGCDWLQFRLGPAHSGYNATENTISVANVSSLVKRFTAATGGIGMSSPAVSNGVVFVGSGDHKLYAFDAAGSLNCSGTPKSCKPLRAASTGSGTESSPAVANGMVYVGSGDGKLLRLRPSQVASRHHPASQ
jgi:outer membrane protein assembly factor BamB